MKKLLLFSGVLLLLFSSCNKKLEKYSKVFKSHTTRIGKGYAWSWVKVGLGEQPLSLGISISQASFNSLPPDDNAHMSFDYLIGMPTEFDLPPFDHIMIDWNPHGHEPIPIYGLPHFDFHFYFISEDEQMMIPPYPLAPDKFDHAPDAAYLPEHYANFGGGVPMMGAHWVDLTSPELDPNNPAKFTQTFVYGSYDGSVTFWEPMITWEYLNNTDWFDRSIPQPAKVERSGFYPTKLHVRKSSGEIQIIMDEFVFREQS